MLDGNGSLVAPITFLDAAERSDLVQEIDRWVIGKAIRCLAKVQRGGGDVVLGVNLSAKSLLDATLPSWISSQLKAHSVAGRGLTFEVTETVAVVNFDGANRFAERLGRLGCGFALDDFGAGFCSFHYLKHLTFDYLKIDGEFIKNLPSSPTDQLIVRAAVQIAQGLGKRTVAEYVQDAATVELLRHFGVDFAQGFHIARPVPLADLDLGAKAGWSSSGTGPGC
jgi:EAL domain-containing protein (putative c-di-GMP-specific phosphodiesterase class I)